MVKAVNELGFKPKMIGGAMVGLQATVFKNQLGPLLNGFVNYETWVPSKEMMYEGTEEFFKKYQARAGAEGVDPLGYYLGGWGYAYIQVLGDAVKGANSLKDDVLADYIRKTTFKTIHGHIKFGANGEWEKGRMLQVQYHGIKQGDGVDVFRGMSYQTVLTPADLKTGDVDLPLREGEVAGAASRFSPSRTDTALPRGRAVSLSGIAWIGYGGRCQPGTCAFLADGGFGTGVAGGFAAGARHRARERHRPPSTPWRLPCRCAHRRR